MVEDLPESRRVLVCQGPVCRKQKSAQVLAAFQTTFQATDQATERPGLTLVASGCLGECGNGPMVLILPEQVWYSRLLPEEVPAIIHRHLIGGKPITAMLYPKFHPGPLT